jgi:hypothetical protein
MIIQWKGATVLILFSILLRQRSGNLEASFRRLTCIRKGLHLLGVHRLGSLRLPYHDHLLLDARLSRSRMRHLLGVNRLGSLRLPYHDHILLDPKLSRSRMGQFLGVNRLVSLSLPYHNYILLDPKLSRSRMGQFFLKNHREVPMEYPFWPILHLDPNLNLRLGLSAQSRLRNQRERPVKCPS